MDAYTTIIVAAPVASEQPEVPVNYEGGGTGSGGSTPGCTIA